MTRPWSLFVHVLPTQALAPNGDRAHWSKVNAARNDLRSVVRAAAEQARPERPFENYELHLFGQIMYGRWADKALLLERTFPKYARPYRPTDPDDLLAACKPAIDALVDAAVLAGDDHMHMRIVSASIMPHISKREDEGIGFSVRTSERSAAWWSIL